jgi:4-amino-4-deoxy-L-arabinose transferase-like glycosyltransferase
VLLLSGLALGCAILTKGPLACLLVIPPLLLAAPRRWPFVLGVALIGTALAAPWYLLAITRYADTLGQLWHEYKLERTEHQPFYYYIGLLGLVLPWTIWFIGGLAFPWARKQSPLRPAAMWAWCWFLFLFIAFSIPVAKHQRYILPIVPSVGLLIGFVIVDHAQLLKCDPRFRGDRWLRLIQQVAMSIVGVVLPFVLLKPQPSWSMAPLSPTAAVALLLALVIIAAFGWTGIRGIPPKLQQLSRNPYWFVAAATIWMSVVMTAAWHCVDMAPRPANIFRQAAQDVGLRIAGKPLGYLNLGGRSAADWYDFEEFHFHLRRITPLYTLETLATATGFIAAPAAEAEDQQLQAAGFQRIADFTPQPDKIYRLWEK